MYNRHHCRILQELEASFGCGSTMMIYSEKCTYMGWSNLETVVHEVSIVANHYSGVTSHNTYVLASVSYTHYAHERTGKIMLLFG